MQSKFYSRLQSTLLLSAGLSLGLVTLIPVTEARIASNGTFPNGFVPNGTFPNSSNLKMTRDASAVSLGPVPTNGILLNGTNFKFNAGSIAQLQLEDSQLVLHLNR